MIEYWARSISLILLLTLCVACAIASWVSIATAAPVTAAPGLRSNIIVSISSPIASSLAIPIAQSPQEEAQLVDIHAINSNIVIDMRYATTNNFMQRKLYPVARCLLRSAVARRLDRVQEELEKRRLGLKVYDCYRPLSVQRLMWQVMPDSRYVANPSRGSRHNRACAVDVTLVDLDGKELPMPTEFDNFTSRAHRNYRGGSPQALKNRQLLEDVMKKHGFIPMPTEWWHFDAVGWEKFPILDVSLEAIP
jgi:zinc D-Ala-D-Ala dipeptidase